MDGLISVGNQEVPQLKELKYELDSQTLYQKRSKLEQWMPKLSAIEMKEIFEMLKSYNIPHSKNRNGVFINLAGLNESMINRLYSYCHYYQNSNQFIQEKEVEEETAQTHAFAAIDKSLMQECVRDAIKDSLSPTLQVKLNQKLSVFTKESNWKHQPIPNNHSKNAELGKVRGRINKRKNNILKRCRDISLYLQKSNSGKEQDVLSGTNDISLDT